MSNIIIKHIHKGTEKKESFIEFLVDGKNGILTKEHFINRYGAELIEEFESE